MKFSKIKEHLKKAAIAAAMAGTMFTGALATVTGNTSLVLTTTGASTDAADTASLSIALVNTILYAFIGEGDVIGALMVLLMILGVVVGIFAAIATLFRSIFRLASASQ